jgi:hypothetical protein
VVPYGGDFAVAHLDAKTAWLNRRLVGAEVRA